MVRKSCSQAHEVLASRIPHIWPRPMGRAHPTASSFVYAARTALTSYDLWLLPVTGDRKPRPFLWNQLYRGIGAVDGLRRAA
jgi:hypothetical protein